ncbi:MAG: hypothetical protein K0S61_3048 [Anaerocolumna sp.]|nr:hypothetical protein [Anaerocolumna sp.]
MFSILIFNLKDLIIKRLNNVRITKSLVKKMPFKFTFIYEGVSSYRQY